MRQTVLYASVLNQKRILLGVSGGIAAYKSAELVRLFTKAGADVNVVMTPAAQKFITPLTLQTLSKHPVGVDTFDLTQEATIGHIELADTADLFVVAPATADVVARLAQGLANDMLTTCALATKAPLLLAPAMNVNMWKHPATQHNIELLVSRGATLVGPDSGELACGWVGAGRMVDPSEIVSAATRILSERDLSGLRVLITAGPTHEPIDPVRYVGNRSSGKMGFALAQAAAERGASVELISGPVALPTPSEVTRTDVETALEMAEAVESRVDAADLVLMVAAVADFRPERPSKQKLKRAKLGPSTELKLTQNPDILAGLGARKYARRPLIVGFAAETADLEKLAQKKLKQKKCDLLVGNDVARPGGVFGQDESAIVILENGKKPVRLAGSKVTLAHQILDRCQTRIRNK